MLLARQMLGAKLGSAKSVWITQMFCVERLLAISSPHLATNGNKFCDDGPSSRNDAVEPAR